MPRTALFVVDIQAELAQDPTTEIPHAERIRHAGAQILARSRAAIEQSRTLDQQPGLEIVIVQHEDRPGAGTLAKGSRPWALVFEPRGGDGAERVVSKQVRELYCMSVCGDCTV
jgi:nicotinamidase-related amidase